jgi:membrane-associated protein
MQTALIPFLDPNNLIDGFGAYALLGVCLVVFAETGLLVGFILPGDTLLIATGVLAVSVSGPNVFGVDIWWICLSIAGAAFAGGEVGYLIGHHFGPRIFERKDSGLFSRKNVERTNAFFVRFGGLAVIFARWVPVVRTFAPIAAGVGKMPWRKYTLYNLIGALIWGAGLTYLGFLVGHIPPVAEFVKNYIDLVLLGVILIVLIPSVYHYVQTLRAARRERHQHAAGVPETAAAETLVLDQSDFVQNPHGKHADDNS